MSRLCAERHPEDLNLICGLPWKHEDANDHWDRRENFWWYIRGAQAEPPKLRYDLIPEPALAAMAHAFTVGTKHGNGIKVDSFATEYAAIMRHLEACRRGETVDPDDGHLHLGAVMARCAKLIATGTKWEDE